MALQLDNATLQAALVGYQQQLQEIEAKMGELRRRLGKKGSGGGGGSSAATHAEPAAKSAPRRHRMSAEGRARIAAAQRARWAKAKRGKKSEE
jgi:hypothetical protein